MNNITPQEVKQIAEEAYSYAFPMLMGYRFATVQHEQPQNEAEKANWLAPPLEGPFYLVMRIYWPKQAALDGTWTPPPVKQSN